MTRLRESDYRAVLEFLRGAETVEGPDPFPVPVLASLQRVVECDNAIFCELDREHRQLISETHTAEVDSDSDSAEEAESTFWRIVEQHPLCVYQQHTGRFDAVKLSDFVTRRQLHQSEIYAEWYRPAGTECELEVGIPSPLLHTKNFLFGREATTDFDERDRSVLNLLQPHLPSLYRHAVVRRRLAAALAALEGSREAVVFLDAGARIAFATVCARRLLRAYFPDQRGSELPDTLAAWLRRQATRLNGEAGLKKAGEPLTVERSEGRLLVHAGCLAAGQECVILLEEQPHQRAPSAEALGLTRRECEVLGLVARGKTNNEIAAMLFVSAKTVRKHLENIFEKLNVRTPYTAVAMRPQTLGCRIGAGLSTSESAWDAAAEAAREARGGPLGGAEVDLAFVFLSAAHLDEADAAAAAVREELAPQHLLGCVAEGVVGGARELEEGPGVAVWAGALPGAEIECFHVAAVETGDGIALAGFPELDDPSLVALLVDPFTFPVGQFLTRLNETHERIPLVGGIASGGRQPGAQALVLDDAVHAEGAVGAVVSGLPVFTVVSQGCRPIGREAVITRCEGNVVYELAGTPALERLRSEIASLSSEEQESAARGLLAGLVIDENVPEYDTDDFLMRGLLGVDAATGALVLGDNVRVGQTLRFFVRDAASADEGLRRALGDALRRGKPAGGLLFTCNGRGTNMFSEPDHDARVVAEALATQAVAGFFCGGEIGPVGGKAFLHGFTATLAVFLEP